jgi:hypothetical protein
MITLDEWEKTYGFLGELMLSWEGESRPSLPALMSPRGEGEVKAEVEAREVPEEAAAQPEHHQS